MCYVISVANKTKNKELGKITEKGSNCENFAEW